MLRLAGIGGLGNMLSPAAMHLNIENSPGRFISIHDRKSTNANKEQRRAEWIAHGATLVSNIEEMFLDKNLDGIVICAGKNGDDVHILTQVINLVSQHYFGSKKPFILHCSTVSVEFVNAAFLACKKQDIIYANYPLTGGTKGAETATMLILASGDRSLYLQLEPVLKKLGKPKYFGEEVAAAAKVKFVSHVMVFNGLLGISSAIALQKKAISLEDQTTVDFFDYLNHGSGGTRQWDVTLKQGVSEDQWGTGFLLPHATVDAIYTADLLIKSNMPTLTIFSILQVALAFCYLMQQTKKEFATQALLKTILDSPNDLNTFLSHYQSLDVKKFLENTINALPLNLKEKVKLEVHLDDFLE